ncbi:MAG: excinuclease ABC subunit UvrC [Oscillospiraceae bacterium]|nr:excinuclease ABC subunit UvrC [Oscillospiraceae bacterium]
MEPKDKINLKEKIAKLPLSPGVYLMKDKHGKIIYIGKAKQLKNRVSSYFNNSDTHSHKTEKLVENICDFDYIVTHKELDALVLESSLIKQHRPKYNVLLKDARGFNYVKITAGGFPRLIYTHNAEDKSAQYIGPYANGFTIRQSVVDANRIFMLPSCAKKFPDEFNKGRPCLNYQIKRCMGVCLGGISEEDYRLRVKAAIDYIKSGSKKSVDSLTAEMEEAAQQLDFEKAARLRDHINAILRTDSVQSVQSKKTTDYDIVAIATNTGLAAATIIKYRSGRLTDKESFYLGSESDEILEEFLIEYYSDNVPREIYLDREIEDKELIGEYLKTKITVPKRGEGLTQVMLTKNNASEYLALKIGRTAKEITALEELAKLLGLSKIPEYIECYDISNIGENVKAGGMVVYRNGKPYKKGYRKFTIKEVIGLDDYACMREVISRRFTRYLSVGDDAREDYGFYKLPDLILLDGGTGHVNAVSGVLNELGIDVPLFGLVKDSKHKTRAIAAKGEEIQVQANKSVFTMLTKIQEEVHRFSVTFTREKHKKEAFALTLTQVEGIGQAKAAALLKKFKTKTALKAASLDELQETAKINQEKAQELQEFIKGM